MSDIQASPAVHAPRRRRKAGSFEAGIGMAIILGWLLLALGASVVAPYDPNGLDLTAVLAAPGEAHWFGTDNLGRDVLSRVIHGARIDIWMGFVGVVVPLIIGVSIGLISSAAREHIVCACACVRDRVRNRDRLGHQHRDSRAQHHIIDLTELPEAQPSLSIDQHEARRTAQFERAHRRRNRIALDRLVDADRHA